MINHSYNFCFTLSSLNILNAQLSDKNLAILKILNFEIKEILKNKNVDRGDSGSGNHSMFYAIFNIYANEFLNLDRNKQIQEWLDFNINSINSNGFGELIVRWIIYSFKMVITNMKYLNI